MSSADSEGEGNGKMSRRLAWPVAAVGPKLLDGSGPSQPANSPKNSQNRVGTLRQSSSNNPGTSVKESDCP